MALPGHQPRMSSVGNSWSGPLEGFEDPAQLGNGLPVPVGFAASVEDLVDKVQGGVTGEGAG